MTARKTTKAETSPKALKQRLQAVSGVKRAPVAEAAAEAVVADKGRKGRKAIAIYMQPLAKEQLVRIAHEHGKTIQDLGIEALNLLFRHYDQKPIA
jgi:hypothetical protein